MSSITGGDTEEKPETSKKEAGDEKGLMAVLHFLVH